MCEIRVGQVLRMMVRDTTPPKVKRFIVVGQSEDSITLAAVYINTELNLNVNWNIDLISQHIEFTADGRDYLTHTSYVDCSKLRLMNINEIEEIIKKRPDVVIGQLTEDDFDLVRMQIIHSTTIKGKIKKRYGFYDQ